MNPIRSLIIVATGVFACSASAVTTLYTFATGTTDTSNGIVNSAGLAYQNSASASFAGPGVVAFGYFSITDAQITGAASAATLASAFNNWNTAGTNIFASPGPAGNRGTFTFNAAARDLTTATGDTFAGKNMYAFVGNGTTFATSSEMLVLKTTFTFDAAEFGPTAIAKTITVGNSSILYGNSVANVFTTTADTSTTPGFQTKTFGAVPEPSAALLGAIGALGLFRRRRN